nr:von Willebrand factor domain containing protein [Haemonchus contortus]
MLSRTKRRMLRLILYALCLFEFIRTGHAKIQSCFVENNPKYSCKRRVIIAIDDVSDGLRKREVEFSITKSILRRLNIRENFVSVALATYGTNASMTYEFNNNRGQVCTNLLTLRSRGKEATEVTPSRKIRNFLYRIVTTIDVEDALLILLVKDCDQKDVDIAGRLLKFNMDQGIVKRFSTAVINMGNSSFDNWYDNEKTNMKVNAMGDIDDIADYVSRFICDTPITTTPSHHTTPPSTPTSSSTQNSTTPRFLTSTSIPRRTTPTSTSTSSSPTVPTNTPAPVVRTSSECECVPKTIWLDVFLLMEAGVFMGSNGISSATDYIVSAFAKMTVGQAEQFQTRLGVIRYASSVDLIADLDVYTSTEDLLDLDILPLNETDTNIEGAIRMARERFESTSHRAAARKVIIIVGSTYREAVLNNPLKVAEQFRAEGGIIITIEYVQEHEKSVPMLRKLASPKYSLINYKDGKQLHAQELRQLLCEANCFCKKKWIPYNTDTWQAPQGGCYYPFLIPSMQNDSFYQPPGENIPRSSRTAQELHNTATTEE